MRYHVRQQRLAAPGDRQRLFAVVAALHQERLDRTRPLFRLHVIDGLDSGQVAIYLKSHHASWDGRSALARIFGTLASEPGPIRTPFFALPANPPQQSPQNEYAGFADGAGFFHGVGPPIGAKGGGGDWEGEGHFEMGRVGSDQ